VQDCAGLGESSDELELATHVATERAAQQADLVLWVHAAAEPWTTRETTACERIPPERRLLVLSKIDLTDDARPNAPAPLRFAATTKVSALAGTGIEPLRAAIAAELRQLPASALQDGQQDSSARVVAALRAARATALHAPESPELVALELRAAGDGLTEFLRQPLDEEVLDRIFSQFCVGK
jgi:tRNA modification GTPase